MIKSGIQSFAGKRVLLLQGPLGPFFARLAKDLQAAGAEVHKVNFNGGDCLFYPTNAISYRGKMDEWPAFFESLIISLRIDVVLMFGDCRSLHKEATQLALQYGLNVGVFEEGYVRPDYITLELYGVNGYSTIPRDPIFYLSHKPESIPKKQEIGNAFPHAALWAVLYYLACAVLWPGFMHYRHHRPLTILESWPWLRGMVRKYWYAYKEKGMQEKLVSEHSKNFFLVPLQVHNDAQIHVHSHFKSVMAFITETMESFASHAPDGTLLVIKHHPMDRGYHDYTRLIRMLADRYGMKERVLYIHDQHLPTLLNHARGVVLINSTVGLSALHHRAPLKVCGDALYNILGLTFKGGLHEFWQQAHTQVVNPELYKRFRNYLIKRTQLNGNFYKRLGSSELSSGVIWVRGVEILSNKRASLSQNGPDLKLRENEAV